MATHTAQKDFEEIMIQLKKKIYHPVYFLMGDEPYYIDKITEYIENNVLTEAEKIFNQSIFYGRDSDVLNIMNTARRYPMAANYQVIIVKEAQDLKDINKLIFYFEKPMPSTIFVVNYKYGKIAANTKLYKSLSQHIVKEFSKIPDYQLSNWVVNYLSEKDFSIDIETAQLLVDSIGNDLNLIVHEIDKLLLLLSADSKKITKNDIEKNIGISKDYNIYELQKAIATKNYQQALTIVKYFSKNTKNHPLVITIGSLFSYFSRLLICHALPEKNQQSIANALGIKPFIANEYITAIKNYKMSAVERIISLLREYDLKSKGFGSNASEGELLRELIYKILNFSNN